jgi:hypothetical protein
MLVKHKEAEFKVGFAHEKKAIPAPKGRGRIFDVRWVTTCTITNMQTGNELGVGEAICRPPDQFSRPKGRKLALARALKKLGSRHVVELASQDPEVELRVIESKTMLALRKAFWDAFFANKPTGMQLPAYDDTADADGEAA